MSIQHFACGSDEADGSRHDIIAVEVDVRIQPEGPPSTTSQLAQQFSVVAEEDSQPLRHRENHLTVGHIFEQLLGGPLCPQELAFFMATRAQTPCLATEAHDELRNHSPCTELWRNLIPKCRSLGTGRPCRGRWFSCSRKSSRSALRKRGKRSRNAEPTRDREPSFREHGVGRAVLGWSSCSPPM